MPPKRPRSIDSNYATESDREFKRPTPTRHQAKWKEAVQDILDLLSPTTNEALAKFNTQEEKKKRDGVVPISMDRVEGELKELRNVEDVESLEARLKEIASYLKRCQDGFNDYIVEHGAEQRVRRNLEEVIYPITVARRRLPGMFSLLDELLRKLNVTIHRT